jgi:hypothetical protein
VSVVDQHGATARSICKGILTARNVQATGFVFYGPHGSHRPSGWVQMRKVERSKIRRPRPSRLFRVFDTLFPVSGPQMAAPIMVKWRVRHLHLPSSGVDGRGAPEWVAVGGGVHMA